MRPPQKHAATRYLRWFAAIVLIMVSGAWQVGCANEHTDICLQVTCGAGEYCLEGRCLPPCSSSQTRCGAACVNTQYNDNHCGACSQPCPKGNHCKDGTCQDIWIAQATGVYPDAHGVKMAIDQANNIYVCGTHRGSGVFGAHKLTNATSPFIAKVDATGTFTWVKGASSGNGECLDITTDAAGHVYITGRINKQVTFGAFALQSVGKGNIFLAKLTPKGDVLWAIRAGANWPHKVAVDSQGAIFIVGNYGQDAVFGTFKPTMEPNQGSRGYVAKLDSKGNFRWVADTQNIGYNTIYGLVLDSKGTPHVTGLVTGPNAFGASTPHEKQVAFYATLDPQGQWDHVKFYDYSFESTRLVVDDKDNIYMVGSFATPVQLGTSAITPLGGSDHFYAKLDKKGAFVWFRQMGNPKVNYLGGLLYSNGTHLFTGGAYPSGTYFDKQVLPGAGEYWHLFALRMDLKGNLEKVHSQSQTSYVQEGYQGAFLHDVVADAKGNIYTVGTFSKELPFQPLPLKNKTGWSLYIAKNLP